MKTVNRGYISHIHLTNHNNMNFYLILQEDAYLKFNVFHIRQDRLIR